MASMTFAARVAHTLALSAMSAACTVGAEASSTDPEIVAEAEEAITHGTATDGDPAVVGLVYPLGEERALWCTGSLIAPTWIVTAGHCVDPVTPVAAAFGSSLDDSDHVPVRSAIVHPDFDRESLEHDLALVELAVVAPATPIELTSVERVGPRPGEIVRLVGFGRAETVTLPRKRTGSARIADIAASTFSVEPAPSLTCSGDSGGPALWTRAGEEVLIGVVSKGDWDCEDHSIFTKLAAATGFLDETVRADETPNAGGCSIEPYGSQLHGSRSLVLALILIGVGAVALRRATAQGWGQRRQLIYSGGYEPLIFSALAAKHGRDMTLTSSFPVWMFTILAAALVACSSSVDDDEATSGTGGNAASSSASGSATGGTSSAGGSADGGATSSSTTASAGGSGPGGAGQGGGGQGGGCDLDAQDCAAADQSCYPTADGAECAPTGDGEAWTQCESNLDCGEGLFCNPHNFMHCVPWCKVAGSDCAMNETCYETADIELPDGYGYCLPN